MLQITIWSKCCSHIEKPTSLVFPQNLIVPCIRRHAVFPQKIASYSDLKCWKTLKPVYKLDIEWKFSLFLHRHQIPYFFSYVVVKNILRIHKMKKQSLHTGHFFSQLNKGFCLLNFFLIPNDRKLRNLMHDL